jgi:putative DNA primase/helicase
VHITDGVIAEYFSDGRKKDRTFCLQEDIQALGQKINELVSVAAVIIDPITAYLGTTDSHKNADVRGLLAPLSNLAGHHDVAIIGISHLTKATGMQALLRVTGSLAFVAAARAAYLVALDPQDQSRRLLLPMKNNLGPDTTGLAFRIHPMRIVSPFGEVVTSRVVWDSEFVYMSADEAMQGSERPRRRSAIADIVEWLHGTLLQCPLPAVEIFERAKAEGIAVVTLRRAANAMGIRKEKAGMTAGWVWSLPPKMIKNPEDAQDMR